MENIILLNVAEEPDVYRPKTVLEIRREAPDEDFRQFMRRVQRHVTIRYRQYVKVSSSFDYRPPMKLREGNVFTGVCLLGWDRYLWSQIPCGLLGIIGITGTRFLPGIGISGLSPLGGWGGGVGIPRGRYQGGRYTYIPYPDTY